MRKRGEERREEKSKGGARAKISKKILKIKGGRHTGRNSKRLTGIFFGEKNGGNRTSNHQASGGTIWWPDGWRLKHTSWRSRGEVEDDQRVRKHIGRSFKGGGGGESWLKEVREGKEGLNLGFGKDGERIGFHDRRRRMGLSDGEGDTILGKKEREEEES